MLKVKLRLRDLNLSVTFNGPLKDTLGRIKISPSLSFVIRALGLSPQRCCPPITSLSRSSITHQLNRKKSTSCDLLPCLRRRNRTLLLLRKPKALARNALLGLSLPNVTLTLSTSILLIAHCSSVLIISQLLTTGTRLRSRLTKIVVGSIPRRTLTSITSAIGPFLRRRKVPMLTLFPQSPVVHDIAINRVITHLRTRILYSPSHVRLVIRALAVKTVGIGSTLHCFHGNVGVTMIAKNSHASVRFTTLRASARYLILAKRVPPVPAVLRQTASLRVPVLTISSSALSAIRQVSRLFNRIHLRRPVGIGYMRSLITTRLSLSQLVRLVSLGLPMSTK